MECKGLSGNRVPSTSIMVPAALWQIRLSTSSPRNDKAHREQALSETPLSPESNVEGIAAAEDAPQRLIGARG